MPRIDRVLSEGQNSNDGESKSYRDFSDLYNIPLYFTTYYGILSYIPQIWKTSMRDILTKNPQSGISKLSDVAANKKVCKIIYEKILAMQTNIQDITGIHRWDRYFSGAMTKDIWLQSFAIMFQTTSNAKLLYHQFQISHFILVTNEDLFKWKIADSDICVWCREEIESLPHIYLECEVVKQFWANLVSWIRRKSGIRLNYNKSRANPGCYL